MRAFLASAIGAACACTAALLVPAAAPSAAAAPVLGKAAVVSKALGGNRTLPLTRLPAERGIAPGSKGLAAQGVKPFSMLGITWNNAAVGLDATVQVRSRSMRTGVWSPWRDVEAENDDVPDLDSPDRSTGRARGGTAPLWVGDSNGIQVRVVPRPTGRSGRSTELPDGLRLDMVDPGAADSEAAEAAESDTLAADPSDDDEPAAPRPRIIHRTGWHANEHLRSGGYIYTHTVRAIFVHHSATGNDYRCSDAPRIIRGIYRYHVRSRGWRDIGYNFLVDKCGTIYEGRAGGVARAVMGAHTLGFNKNSAGVAVIGTFNRHRPSAAALRGLEQLSAWKLGLYGRNPKGHTRLRSAGSNRYRRGVRARFDVISGHRDGFTTDCPGAKLYERLGLVRQGAARMQGR
ncbi:peptidoglycan recognition protein family protein [Streptantibioticus ferralitis]|uniref:Peptidoglycan recognition protein n=1 Tax=Streptantibioticus ferralitis TaxID=236510 RepID=A0ABT5Z985_9ACTN|nr:peptidoglycan recognition protein [Streptantibioticus ferralitis]MDF2260392.1 peptidoglycan recognition protein [Streptantibioticus ferralitis]